MFRVQRRMILKNLHKVQGVTDEKRNWLRSTGRCKEEQNRNHAPIGFKAMQGSTNFAGRKDLEAVEPSFISFENDSCIGWNVAPTGHVCVVVNVKSRAFIWSIYLNVLYACLSHL